LVMANFILKSFKGGFSDYEDKGVEGAFKSGKNLNIRKKADTLSCNQALLDLTPPAQGFNTLADWWVPSSDGNYYAFSRNGRIYKFTPDLTCTLVYTDTDGAILGAWEWGVSSGKKYLFWATATKLHRKEIPGEIDWSDIDADAGWPKTNLTSSLSHMMRGIGGGIGALVICNDETLALVGYDDSYTNEILRFTPGNYAKVLLQRDKNVVIGTVAKNQLVQSALFLWDGMDTEEAFGWDDSKPIPLQDIAAIIDTEVSLLVDGKGQVFNADFLNGLPIFTFPDNGKVNPGGVTSEEYLALFGVWGNGAEKSGIYSYGRKFKNASIVPNLEYQFDCDEIGGVIKVGDHLLISYKSGANYGVKDIDQNNKAEAVYETIDLWQPAKTGFQKTVKWNSIVLTTAPLPADCSISVKYKLNKNGEFKVSNLRDGETAFDTEGAQEAVFFVGDLGKVEELQVTLTPSGNDTPEIYRIEPYFEY